MNEAAEAGNAGQETGLAEAEDASQIEDTAAETPESSESQPSEGQAPETAENANAGEPDAAQIEADRQAKIDYAFAKKQKELREERQLREKEAQKRQELEQRLAKYETGQRPEVQALPDPYDPEYDLKIAQREKQIRKQEQWDQQKRYNEQLSQQQAQEARNAHIKRVNDAVQTFQKRTKALGLDEKQVAESEALIAQFVTPQSAELVEHFLTDDDGPLIVQFLASNPFELDKLSSMSVAKAAVYIERKVKPNAQKLKPATTQTPKPATVLEGKGGEDINPLIKGATFE